MDIVRDMSSTEGSSYSPRLLLSLISGLSVDSRFVAAHRKGDYNEWRLWQSRTFSNQIASGSFNFTQIHALGALNWGKSGQPDFTPITDPSSPAAEEADPESLSVLEIHRRLKMKGR